jgi:hypothetical protein
LIPLGCFWGKKIGEFLIFTATWMVPTKGLKRTPKENKATNPNKPKKILAFAFHRIKYRPKEE